MSAPPALQAALTSIAALVDAPGAFEQLAPPATAATRTLVEADGVWLCVRRRHLHDLVLRHADGVEPRQAYSSDLPIAVDALVEAAMLAGAPLRIDDYASHDLSDPHLRAQGVTGVLAAPIACGDRLLGTLIAFRRTGPFRADAETELTQAGLTMALVLVAHDTRRAHHQALQREQVLARAAAASAAAPDLVGAMEHTAAGARRAADAECGAVVLIDGPSARIVGLAGEVLRDDPVEGVRALPAGLGRGRPLLFVDTLTLLARLGLQPERPAAFRGRLAVVQPIADGTEVFGALLVILRGAAPDPAIFGTLETLAGNAAGVLRRERLRTQIETAYMSTVTALANALEAKDHDTHEHASATARLAVTVGRELGLTADELRDLEFTAVLHDVGKIAIPDAILSKPGALTEDEWVYVREHTIVGERILRGVPFLGSAAAGVRSAHERWDGTGYPDGLTREGIPLLSRIVFACDTWDAMTSRRPYREALDVDEAERRLAAEAGRQLDPSVVDALLRVIGRAPARASIAA